MNKTHMMLINRTKQLMSQCTCYVSCNWPISVPDVESDVFVFYRLYVETCSGKHRQQTSIMWGKGRNEPVTTEQVAYVCRFK